ncbi:DUF397 domain-containing protein [Streptomyces olivoreticuli]
MQYIGNGTPSTRISGVLWRKSRYSNPNGNCVELAQLPDSRIVIRDSRRPEGPALVHTRDELSEFISGLKSSSFKHSFE